MESKEEEKLEEKIKEETKEKPKVKEIKEHKEDNRIVEERKNKLKEKFPWLKDNYNLMFLAVLLVFIGIRIYYFALTYDQPLWWDEADYMDMARNWLGGPRATHYSRSRR